MAGELRIAVVGDWVVDDHWVTGIHRSHTSSRTGLGHYRALHGLNSVVESIGAAGRVASVLRRAKCTRTRFCNILGVGLWHREDGAEIANLLQPQPVEKQRNMHRVTRSTSESVDGVKLVNLMHVLLNLRGDVGERGTIRVIRVYQQTGARLDLIQRIDWELPLADIQKIGPNESQFLDGSQLEDELRHNHLDAVVVKDICKGVVSQGLIKWLVEHVDNVPWFISTKDWQPEWLSELADSDVRLLVIPQVPAQIAIRDTLLSRWLTRSGSISREGLEVIEGILKRFNKTPTILVLPKGSAILAREPSGHCILQTQEHLQEHAVSVPMASVLFPSLVAGLLYNVEEDFEILLKRAFSFTHDWMGWNANQVEACETWQPDNEPSIDLRSSNTASSLGSWSYETWTEPRGWWDKSLSGIGVVERESRACLELWRSMTELDGYVCCVERKRTIIRELIRELRTFKDPGGRQMKGFMFVAPPGFGKTYLASCLAKYLGLRLLSFDITQMLSREDVLACFDTVVTTQARDPDVPVLVFFDEINAELVKQHVYDFFLAPLEQNAYVRGGKTFHIDPCVWLFAGTEPLVNPSVPERNQASKASDLQSRLSCAPFTFVYDTKNAKEARMEHVYMGASLLRSAFADVRRISAKVLWMFQTLPAELEVRDLRNIVRRFDGIQYGEVLSSNAPDAWVESNYKFPRDGWVNRPEGDKIEIIG